MSREAMVFALYLWLFWASGALFGVGLMRYHRDWLKRNRSRSSCKTMNYRPRPRVYNEYF